LSQVPETRDSLLLRLVDAADHEAWGQFAAIYRPLVYRVARRRGLQDADAQDLAQQVLLSVAGAIGQWQTKPERAKFRTWLHTVAKNAIIDRLRATRLDVAKGGTSAQLQLQEAADDRVDVAERELEREYQREVFRWAARQVREELEETTWLAFWHSAVEGMPIPAVADKLGKTVGAIYVARSRVIRRLREVTQHELGGDDANEEPGVLR
jgi:RNA polymerase sigma-70 factor (ECF subfamily)